MTTMGWLGILFLVWLGLCVFLWFWEIQPPRKALEFRVPAPQPPTPRRRKLTPPCCQFDIHLSDEEALVRAVTSNAEQVNRP